MANKYKGNQHRYGVVIGSFVDAIVAIVLGCLICRITVFALLASIFMAIVLVCFGLDNYFFGKGIIHSKHMKRSERPILSKYLFWIMIISFVVFMIFFIISIYVIF